MSEDFRFWKSSIFDGFVFFRYVCNFGGGVGIFDAHGWIRLEISLRLLATRPQMAGSRPHLEGYPFFFHGFLRGSPRGPLGPLQGTLYVYA